VNRAIRLSDAALGLLQSLAVKGPLPLQVIDLDDVMALGGSGLVRVLDEDQLGITERGCRFLAATGGERPRLSAS
jgi:hypothetical protein